MNTEYQPFKKFDLSHFTLCEAAPDLLAALESIITEWKASPSGIVSGGKILIAATAVKKAKGDK